MGVPHRATPSGARPRHPVDGTADSGDRIYACLHDKGSKGSVEFLLVRIHFDEPLWSHPAFECLGANHRWHPGGDPAAGVQPPEHQFCTFVLLLGPLVEPARCCTGVCRGWWCVPCRSRGLSAAVAAASPPQSSATASKSGVFASATRARGFWGAGHTSDLRSVA